MAVGKGVFVKAVPAYFLLVFIQFSPDDSLRRHFAKGESFTERRRTRERRDREKREKEEKKERINASVQCGERAKTDAQATRRDISRACVLSLLIL